MSIKLTALKKLKKIDKAIVHSHDLSLYLLSIIVDGEEHYVVDKDNKPLKTFNKLEFQALFDKIAVGQMVLRQQSAYDEMVGQPLRDGDNTLEVSLGNREIGGSIVDNNKGSNTLH